MRGYCIYFWKKCKYLVAECFVKRELFRVLSCMIVICCPAMAGGFSFIASFSWLVSGMVNKAVKFKAVLLASKSNIFYCLNPSTRGFTADPSIVPFKAT